MAAIIRQGLAEQIRETRDARGWSQAELGARCGKAQAVISQLEDPDYGNYTLKSLQRLAEAFDVALIVRFEPFGRFAEHLVSMEPHDLAVPGYEQEIATPEHTPQEDDVLSAIAMSNAR